MEAFAVASIHCLALLIEIAFAMLNLYLILIAILIKTAPEWITSRPDSMQSALTLLFVLDFAIWIVIILNWLSTLRIGGVQ